MARLDAADDPVRFAARKDAWLVVTIAVITAVTVGLCVQLIGSPARLMTKLLLGPVLLCGSGFLLWTLFGTSYQLTSTALLVRVGPLRWRIPLASIIEVSPDRNLASSAALSYERLHIRQSGDTLDTYVSPRDRQRFLDVLASRCPELERVGEHLVRNGEARLPV